MNSKEKQDLEYELQKLGKQNEKLKHLVSGVEKENEQLQ